MSRKNILSFAVFFLMLGSATPQSHADPVGGEIDFVSDTQQPMAIEKIRLRANHNKTATSMIFSDILKRRPLAVFMLGDIVSVGSRDSKWRRADGFIDSCHKNNIRVHALLGNHDVMWNKSNGEKKFQKRFPDGAQLGYVSTVDSIAVIMLNSNFKKLSGEEIAKETKWYRSALDSLDGESSIRAIIVCCHHAPYSNSLIVGSSVSVQNYFVPDFLREKKCILFITGHAHAFEHFIISGKDFLTIGGGGGLHQPLDTSAGRIPDIASDYKPMFHYLSLQRKENTLAITSHFLKPDFSGFEKGYSFELSAAK
jgi:Icc-related predicted phosphoesterase